MEINKLLLDIFKTRFKVNAYLWNDEPYKLNIVGVRSNNAKAGRFDDWLYVIYTDHQNRERLHQFPCTVDSGIYGLETPVHEKGTGILCPQQMQLEIRKHRGEYDALCQASDVYVYRDDNRDKILDFDKDTIMQMNPQEGGFNLHKKGHDSENILWSSVGCTVTYPKYFTEIMSLAYKHRRRHSNCFDYTLFSDIVLDRFNVGQVYTEQERLVQQLPQIKF